jgi:hypothetical protein
MALSWRKFQSGMKSYSEAELLALLNEERTQHHRITMLERIHQRYCIVRASRERLEILGENKAPL